MFLSQMLKAMFSCQSDPVDNQHIYLSMRLLNLFAKKDRTQIDWHLRRFSFIHEDALLCQNQILILNVAVYFCREFQIA